MLTAETAYLFAHTLLREAAYELHLPSERARLHGLALASMERVLSRELQAHLRELALHASLAAQGAHGRAFGAKERRYLAQWAESAWKHFDFQAALDASLRIAAMRHKGSRSWVEAMIKAANACRNLSQFRRGRGYAKDALRQLRGKSLKLRAELEQVLGALAYGLADYAGAARHAGRARKFAKAAKSSSQEALAVNLLGIQVWSRGDLRAGLKLLERAESLFRRCRNSDGVYVARMNRGIIYSDLGDLKRALELQTDCLKNAQSRRDLRRLASVLSNLGIVHRKLGDIPAAREAYRRADEYARACGNRELQAANLCNIGNLESMAGRHESGFACLTEARDIARELGDSAAVALYTINLAPYYEKRGDFDRALEVLDQGIAMARATGARHYMASANSQRASLLLLRKEPEQAVAAAQESVALFHTMGLVDGIEAATARVYLTIALAESGRIEKAKAALDELNTHKRGYAQFLADPDPDNKKAIERLKAHGL